MSRHQHCDIHHLFCSSWRTLVEGRPLGVRTSRVLLGVLNKRSRDPLGVDVNGMWAQRLCTRSTPGRTSCIGSVLNPVWVSDAANPVPNLLFTRHTSKPAQDLLRQVMNVHFMVFSKDGATASLDPHGAQKGSLTQDYVNFPTLKFGMFLPFLPSSPVTSVDATDRQSSLIGHPSCHPID